MEKHKNVPEFTKLNLIKNNFRNFSKEGIAISNAHHNGENGIAKISEILQKEEVVAADSCSKLQRIHKASIYFSSLEKST